jgi:hypothetical protein
MPPSGATKPTRARLSRSLAVVLHPLTAIHAQPTAPWAVHDDGIAERETRCTGTHLFDPTGVLVPEGEGQRDVLRPSGSFQQMQIGVTRARTAYLNQHLAGPWLGHTHVTQLTRLLPLDELKCLDSATSVRDPVELDLEMQRPAEDLVHPVGRRIDDQPWVLDAPKERLQRDVDLQACQWTADATVYSAAPTHVLVVRALDVEPLNQTAVWVAAALLVLLTFSWYALRSWSPRVASLGADGRHHRLYHRRRLHHDRPDRIVRPRTGRRLRQVGALGNHDRAG